MKVWAFQSKYCKLLQNFKRNYLVEVSTTDCLMPSDKLIMAKAMGLIYSLFDVASVLQVLLAYHSTYMDLPASSFVYDSFLLTMQGDNSQCDGFSVFVMGLVQVSIVSDCRGPSEVLLMVVFACNIVYQVEYS